MAMMSIIQQIVSFDLFQKTTEGEWASGQLIGRPFKLSYHSASVAMPDAWKQRCEGVPQGCFLLAYYDFDKEEEAEALLLRVLRPAQLPTDQDVVASMIEYYKDNIRTGSTAGSQLDSYTRYEFSFSGVECSVLGTFYKDAGGRTRFGADVENFFSAHNYSVVKPGPQALALIANYRGEDIPGGPSDVRIGVVRYSSSRRGQERENVSVPVYVNAKDFAGKRTALFGMTRTGKSNTIKKMIEAIVEMSGRAPNTLADASTLSSQEILEPFGVDGNPRFPIGQIIFDINGEYANANLQDQGTAIFDRYANQTIRYAAIPKPGFRELKVNFYREIDNGFDLLRNYPTIEQDTTRFVVNFRAVDLSLPSEDDRSAYLRAERRRVVYLCALYEAGFVPPANFTVSWSANEAVRNTVNVPVNADRRGVVRANLAAATEWWKRLWEIYDANRGQGGCFAPRPGSDEPREWADDDLKALLVMLTRRSAGAGSVNCSGFRIFNPVRDQHTSTIQGAFEADILAELRAGRIIIVDLSIGDPFIQGLFSERICRAVFNDALRRFTRAEPNNFIQFYFEEAHNLFPKKEDKDLTQIYNRLAKEGAKLNLGLVYATQEVSSISGNILKATQNWFIAHLNNEDETRELRKYYDFCDFTDALVRFSQDTDKGFVRMKTYSSSYVVPVQIDRFAPTVTAANGARSGL
jgi:Helicase HerA, central domain